MYMADRSGLHILVAVESRQYGRDCVLSMAGARMIVDARTMQ